MKEMNRLLERIFALLVLLGGVGIIGFLGNSNWFVVIGIIMIIWSHNIEKHG